MKIIPAELLKPDGSVDRASVSGSHSASYYGGPESSWNYTLRGTDRVGSEPASAEEWIPQFFYHGARYLQVERTGPPGGDVRPGAVDHGLDASAVAIGEEGRSGVGTERKAKG